MRLTTVILIASLLQVSAATMAQRISLTETNTPLKTVLRAIKGQSGYNFVCSETLLKQARLVNINLKDVQLDVALKQVFDGQSLTYVIENNTIIVKPKGQPSLIDNLISRFQKYEVLGQVLDENGRPLVGANIWIVSQRKVYISNAEGRFRLQEMTGNEMLLTSYLGYKTDTLQLNGQRNVTIRMVSGSATLSSVTVLSTGYQTITKERATGSYARPDMEAFNNRVATTDLVSRLEGLVAGMTVKGGAMGTGINEFGAKTNQQSVIRGISSVRQPSDPLYVVDGVQVPGLSYVNANDVADITVLKDAAASAIYGAKAANGVIVITTKTAKKGQKIQINYNGTFSLQGKPKFRDNYYLNSAQYIQTARELFDPVTFPPDQLSYGFTAPHERILYNRHANRITEAQANKSLDSLSGLNNRKQVDDLLYRNSFTTNHTLSASGGSRNYSIYSSLSYTNNRSSKLGDQNNSYQISVNQTLSPVSWITVGLNTSLNNSRIKSKSGIDVGAGFLPYQMFADANGNPLLMNYMTGWSAERQADYQLRSRINLDYIPLEEIDKGYGNMNMLNINNTANAEIRFWKGLSFKGTYGYQKTSGTATFYDDHTSMSRRKELLNFTVANTAGDVPVYYLPTTGGRFSNSDRTAENWTIRNQLVFNTALRGGQDRLNVQVGQEALEQNSVINTFILRGYDDVLKTYSLLNYVSLAQPLFGAIGSGFSMFTEKPYERQAQKSRFTSYFGLLNYSFNDKYLLDASIRADKSSLFASDEAAQNKPAFSIGGKWLLSKEKWFSNINWLNNLGLRATYGITGNSPYVGQASTFDILQGEQDPDLGNYLGIYFPANNKLSWEATHTWNFGLDFGFLDGRLNGSTELYFKNTKDLLGMVRYNPFNGMEGTTGNIGNIKNSGVELTMSSVNMAAPDFSWSTNMVFSYNYNKLMSYSIPSQFSNTASSLVFANYWVGYARQPIFAYRYAGLDHMGDPQIRKADGTITKDPEAAAPEDMVYMGTAQPKVNGGLSNTFRYKTFTLSANLVYNFGAVMRRQVERNFSGRLTVGSFSDGNRMAEFANRWKKAGDEAYTNVPSYVSSQGLSYSRRNIDYYVNADINVISASYVKLRDITLSYDLSSALLGHLSVQKVNLFVQTGNLMVWKANKAGIDPEYPASARANQVYSLGLNVSF